jgi:rubrerythrin
VARILTDDHDEHGQYRPRHGDDEHERRERLPRGGSDETYVWRCSMCGRGRDAISTCAICGDHEDMAA